MNNEPLKRFRFLCPLMTSLRGILMSSYVRIGFHAWDVSAGGWLGYFFFFLIPFFLPNMVIFLWLLFLGASQIVDYYSMDDSLDYIAPNTYECAALSNETRRNNNFSAIFFLFSFSSASSFLFPFFISCFPLSFFSFSSSFYFFYLLRLYFVSDSYIISFSVEEYNKAVSSPTYEAYVNSTEAPLIKYISEHAGMQPEDVREKRE